MDWRIIPRPARFCPRCGRIAEVSLIDHEGNVRDHYCEVHGQEQADKINAARGTVA